MGRPMALKKSTGDCIEGFLGVDWMLEVQRKQDEEGGRWDKCKRLRPPHHRRVHRLSKIISFLVYRLYRIIQHYPTVGFKNLWEALCNNHCTQCPVGTYVFPEPKPKSLGDAGICVRDWHVVGVKLT